MIHLDKGLINNWTTFALNGGRQIDPEERFVTKEACFLHKKLLAAKTVKKIKNRLDYIKVLTEGKINWSEK